MSDVIDPRVLIDVNTPFTDGQLYMTIGQYPPDISLPGFWYGLGWSFDWVRNVSYRTITGSGKSGIEIMDLRTMVVSRNVLMDYMYADTEFGEPPGYPPDQSIWDHCCVQGGNLYLTTSGTPGSHIGEFCRLTRVDPNSMKVTGEFYVSDTFPPPVTCLMSGGGDKPIANRTNSKEFVIAISNAALGIGLEIFDGDTMAPIGISETPPYSTYHRVAMAGRPGGDSCDFWMINWDDVGGDVVIHRITIDDGANIDEEYTGHFNALDIMPALSSLAISQWNWDAAHNCFLLWFCYFDGLGPFYLASVNYNGTINWMVGPDNTEYFHGGYGATGSNLVGTTLMIGSGLHEALLDTGNGHIVYEGTVSNTTVPYAFGNFYRTYNAARMEYFSFILSYAEAKVSFVPAPRKRLANAKYINWLTCCDRGIMGHLYHFRSLSGVDDYFTDLDVPIDFEGVIWKCDSLRFEGLQRKVGIGFSVDEQNLKIWASPTDTMFGANFLSGAEEGLLDGAVIVRKRIIWEFISGNVALDVQNPPLFSWTLFTGYTSSMSKGGSSHVELKVKSALLKLNVNMPRNYYQPGCLWTLFDRGCTLNRDNYVRHGSVSGGNANNIAVSGGVNNPYSPDGIATYAQGRLVFTSGVNNSLQVLIDDNDTIAFRLAYPLNTLPNDGDTFDYYPGCSKSFNTCKLKFNNQNNFRGFDKVPPVMISV